MAKKKTDNMSVVMGMGNFCLLILFVAMIIQMI